MALLYVMTPGSTEIAQNVYHLVFEGHDAHDHPEHAEDEEHGCSGPYHMCACHSTVAFQVAPPRPVGDALVVNKAVLVTAARVAADLLEHVPCPGRSSGPARRGWIRRVFDAIWYGAEGRRAG